MGNVLGAMMAFPAILHYMIESLETYRQPYIGRYKYKQYDMYTQANLPL